MSFCDVFCFHYLESGDIPGYRAAAAEVVSRFGMASNPDTLNPVAWLCTYAPDAVADLTVPVQMAEAALAAYPADEKRFALNTLGAALYRAGRIDEAIARLNESVKASGGAGVPQDWVYLAMAHYKKGNGEEARRWLEKVRAHVKDEKIAFSSDLVETRILLKEAEAVLREPPPAPLSRPREHPRPTGVGQAAGSRTQRVPMAPGERWGPPESGPKGDALGRWPAPSAHRRHRRAGRGRRSDGPGQPRPGRLLSQLDRKGRERVRPAHARSPPRTRA